MKKIIIFLLVIFSSFSLLSQQNDPLGTIWDAATGAVEYNAGITRKFTSKSGETSQAESQMFICDIGSLFSPFSDRTGGIIADVAGNSKVVLTVYSLAAGTTGKGRIIYRLTLAQSSDTFAGAPEDIDIPLNSLNKWRSDDILTLSGAANIFVAFDAQCTSYADNYVRNFFTVNTGKYFMNDQANCLPGQHYKKTQPVIIEMEIHGKATVKKLKVPGVV